MMSDMSIITHIEQSVKRFAARQGRVLTRRQRGTAERELNVMNQNVEQAVRNEQVWQRNLRKVVAAAMMTAIVFVGNYLRIVLPISVGGNTAFTLANIFCALSGILLGPWWGFLAAGLGSGLYDLTFPAYVAEAPITFFTKGMYGLVAGLVLYLVFVRLLKKGENSYAGQLVATIFAALGYLVVYSIKNFFYNGMFVEGYSSAAQCWAVVVAKLPASVFNGVVAAIFAPILGVAIMKALKAANLDRLVLPDYREKA